MGETQVGGVQGRKRQEESGEGARDPRLLRPVARRADSQSSLLLAPRLRLSHARGEANSLQRTVRGVRFPWPQTSATLPTLGSQIPSAPGLRSQDGETLEGDRDSPEGDPDAPGEIRGPRREAATGCCRDAALAALQRRWPFPGGAEFPLPPQVQLRSEVPLPQDLLSLAVCAGAEGGKEGGADRWASASAASAAVRGGDPAGWRQGGRAGTRREVRGGRACRMVLGAQHAGRRTPPRLPSRSGRPLPGRVERAGQGSPKPRVAWLPRAGFHLTSATAHGSPRLSSWAPERP